MIQFIAVAPGRAEQAVLAESRDDVEPSGRSIAREGLDDHPVDCSKRREPAERVGGVEDPQGPNGGLVDLAGCRSARTHALPPAEGLQ